MSAAILQTADVSLEKILKRTLLSSRFGIIKVTTQIKGLFLALLMKRDRKRERDAVLSGSVSAGRG